MMQFSFRRKKKIITALEIDNDWLKVVQAQPSAKEKKISKIVAEKISSLQDKEISQTLRKLSKELEINSNLLVLSVPHHLVAIRNLELPSTNPAEIKDMVELQVGKQTPFAKEEIIYDYQILSTNAEGYSRVMLAIVHQDVVGRYFKLLEAAGLKTEKIALSSDGLLGWCRFACKDQATDEPYALIKLNYDNSEFVVILKNKLIFCRNISVRFSQSQDLINEGIKKFIEEINYSTYAYQNEMIEAEIAKIIITGPEMLVEKLNEVILKEKLNLSAEIIPQFKNIPEIKGVLDEYEANGKNISTSCLLGLCLSFPEQKMNLIPQQLRIEKGVRERGRDLYLFGTYLVFILVTISSVFLGRMYNKEQHLAQLEQQITQMQEKVDKLDSMTEEIEVIERRILTKGFSMNFLYEIHKDISPEIYLTTISFDGKDHLTLRGTSNTMSEIFKFCSALEGSQYFQNVKTKYATTRKEEGKEITDFEIVCPLDASLKEQLIEK